MMNNISIAVIKGVYNITNKSFWRNRGKTVFPQQTQRSHEDSPRIDSKHSLLLYFSLFQPPVPEIESMSNHLGTHAPKFLIKWCGTAAFH